MSITSTQVTLATTPTLIVTADPDGCRVVIHKQQQHTIYLGGSDVSTSNGFLFDHDGTVEIAMPPNTKLYGCAASGTETVYTLVIGG